MREAKDEDAPPVVRVTTTSTVKGTVVVSADITDPWLAVSVQTASCPTNPHATSPPKDERVGMSIVSDIPLGPSTSVTIKYLILNKFNFRNYSESVRVNGISVVPAGSTPFRTNVVDSGPAPTMATESSLLGPANPITNNEEASCALATRKPGNQYFQLIEYLAARNTMRTSCKCNATNEGGSEEHFVKG